MVILEVCKIFKKMTNKRLIWYLEKKKKIDDRYFGFRNQRITIDATSKIITKLLDGFRRKMKTAAIFFDMEKIYDKFNREKRFVQLQNMGIQEKMMEFIRELIS